MKVEALDRLLDLNLRAGEVHGDRLPVIWDWEQVVKAPKHQSNVQYLYCVLDWDIEADNGCALA